LRDLHPRYESLLPPDCRKFDFSSHESGTYQRDDTLATETVGQEHRLDHAVRPRGKHIEYVAGLGRERATGSTH
jgi:hypothetical protein